MRDGIFRTPGKVFLASPKRMQQIFLQPFWGMMNKRHQVHAGGGGRVAGGFFVIISTASLESEVSPLRLFFPFLFKTSHQEPCGFGTSKDVRGSTEVWHWRSHRKGSQIGKGRKKTQPTKKQIHNPKDFGMWCTLNRLWLNSMIYTWTWWLHRSFPTQIVLWFYEIWHLPTQVRNKTS